MQGAPRTYGRGRGGAGRGRGAAHGTAGGGGMMPPQAFNGYGAYPQMQMPPMAPYGYYFFPAPGACSMGDGMCLTPLQPSSDVSLGNNGAA